MIKTILADDHRLFCDGLERLLNETGKFEVIQKYHDGKNVLDGMAKHKPDLLVVDIEMPGLDGLDVVKRIRVSNQTTKIVVLSMHEENVFASEALNLGANAYLTKSVDSNVLIDLLQKVSKGEVVMVPRVSKMNFPDSPLSQREHEILKLISHGETSVEIAAKLHISFLTVKAHRRNIMRKLATKNTAELLTKAIEMGLL